MESNTQISVDIDYQIESNTQIDYQIESNKQIDYQLMLFSQSLACRHESRGHFGHLAIS